MFVLNQLLFSGGGTLLSLVRYINRMKSLQSGGIPWKSKLFNNANSVVNVVNVGICLRLDREDCLWWVGRRLGSTLRRLERPLWRILLLCRSWFGSCVLFLSSTSMKRQSTVRHYNLQIITVIFSFVLFDDDDFAIIRDIWSIFTSSH